jgi:hypothetical protein
VHSLKQLDLTIIQTLPVYDDIPPCPDSKRQEHERQQNRKQSFPRNTAIPANWKPGQKQFSPTIVIPSLHSKSSLKVYTKTQTIFAPPIVNGCRVYIRLPEFFKSKAATRSTLHAAEGVANNRRSTLNFSSGLILNDVPKLSQNSIPSTEDVCDKPIDRRTKALRKE